MKVRELLKTKGNRVVTIQPQETLVEASRRLTENSIGALLVLALDSTIEGIVSERDLVKVCANQNGNLGASLVRDAMSTNLLIGVPEDEVDYILGIMTLNRIRHVPIMDQGKLLGIISIGDVVKARIQETEVKSRYLEEYIFGQ